MELEKDSSDPFLCSRPSPFAETAEFRFVLPTPGRARSSAYNIAGRLVCTLVDSPMGAGSCMERWNGRDGTDRRVSVGTYFAALEAGNEIQQMRMVSLH